MDSPHAPSNPPSFKPACAKCAAVRADVLQTLRRSGYPPLRNVECEVKGQTIVLHGVVPTYHLKQLVQTLALKVDEVRTVQNLIEVR
jgi:osmotically-inducible protein OsmY